MTIDKNDIDIINIDDPNYRLELEKYIDYNSIEKIFFSFSSTTIDSSLFFVFDVERKWKNLEPFIKKLKGLLNFSDIVTKRQFEEFIVLEKIDSYNYNSFQENEKIIDNVTDDYTTKIKLIRFLFFNNQNKNLTREKYKSIINNVKAVPSVYTNIFKLFLSKVSFISYLLNDKKIKKFDDIREYDIDTNSFNLWKKELLDLNDKDVFSKTFINVINWVKLLPNKYTYLFLSSLVEPKSDQTDNILSFIIAKYDEKLHNFIYLGKSEQLPSWKQTINKKNKIEFYVKNVKKTFNSLLDIKESDDIFYFLNQKHISSSLYTARKRETILDKILKNGISINRNAIESSLIKKKEKLLLKKLNEDEKEIILKENELLFKEKEYFQFDKESMKEINKNFSSLFNEDEKRQLLDEDFKYDKFLSTFNPDEKKRFLKECFKQVKFLTLFGEDVKKQFLDKDFNYDKFLSTLSTDKKKLLLDIVFKYTLSKSTIFKIITLPDSKKYYKKLFFNYLSHLQKSFLGFKISQIGISNFLSFLIEDGFDKEVTEIIEKYNIYYEDKNIFINKNYINELLTILLKIDNSLIYLRRDNLINYLTNIYYYLLKEISLKDKFLKELMELSEDVSEQKIVILEKKKSLIENVNNKLIKLTENLSELKKVLEKKNLLSVIQYKQKPILTFEKIEYCLFTEELKNIKSKIISKTISDNVKRELTNLYLFHKDSLNKDSLILYLEIPTKYIKIKIPDLIKEEDYDEIRFFLKNENIDEVDFFKGRIIHPSTSIFQKLDDFFKSKYNISYPSFIKKLRQKKDLSKEPESISKKVINILDDCGYNGSYQKRNITIKEFIKSIFREDIEKKSLSSLNEYVYVQITTLKFIKKYLEILILIHTDNSSYIDEKQIKLLGNNVNNINILYEQVNSLEQYLIIHKRHYHIFLSFNFKFNKNDIINDLLYFLDDIINEILNEISKSAVYIIDDKNVDVNIDERDNEKKKYKEMKNIVELFQKNVFYSSLNKEILLDMLNNLRNMVSPITYPTEKIQNILYNLINSKEDIDQNVNNTIKEIDKVIKINYNLRFYLKKKFYNFLNSSTYIKNEKKVLLKINRDDINSDYEKLLLNALRLEKNGLIKLLNYELYSILTFNNFPKDKLILSYIDEIIEKINKNPSLITKCKINLLPKKLMMINLDYKNEKSPLQYFKYIFQFILDFNETLPSFMLNIDSLLSFIKEYSVNKSQICNIVLKNAKNNVNQIKFSNYLDISTSSFIEDHIKKIFLYNENYYLFFSKLLFLLIYKNIFRWFYANRNNMEFLYLLINSKDIPLLLIPEFLMTEEKLFNINEEIEKILNDLKNFLNGDSIYLNYVSHKKNKIQNNIIINSRIPLEYMRFKIINNKILRYDTRFNRTGNTVLYKNKEIYKNIFISITDSEYFYPILLLNLYDSTLIQLNVETGEIKENKNIVQSFIIKNKIIMLNIYGQLIEDNIIIKDNIIKFFYINDILLYVDNNNNFYKNDIIFYKNIINVYKDESLFITLKDKIIMTDLCSTIEYDKKTFSFIHMDYNLIWDIDNKKVVDEKGNSLLNSVSLITKGYIYIKELNTLNKSLNRYINRENIIFNENDIKMAFNKNEILIF